MYSPGLTVLASWMFWYFRVRIVCNNIPCSDSLARTEFEVM